MDPKEPTNQEILDTIVSSMTELESNMATKEDLKGFATKEDLKGFATKVDFRQMEHRLLDNMDEKLQILKQI